MERCSPPCTRQIRCSPLERTYVSDERPNQHSRSAGMETWYPNLHPSFGSGPLQLFPLLRYLRRRSSLRALHLDVYGPQGGDFCGQNKLFALCDLILTLNLFLQNFPKNHDSQILIFLSYTQNRAKSMKSPTPSHPPLTHVLDCPALTPLFRYF